MNSIKIIKWRKSNYFFDRIKRFDYYELIDYKTGRVVEKIKSKKDEVIFNGFYIIKNKRKVSCFNFQGNHWLRVDDSLFNLSDNLLKITSNTNWPNLITEIVYDKSCIITIKDFAPVRICNSKIDFTYDLLDFSMDFFSGDILLKYISSQKKK